MSALEEIILSKIRKMDEVQQQRVLEFVEGLGASTFDFKDWFRRVEAFQQELKSHYGENYSVGVQDMLDEIREEASWPRQ